MIAIHKSSGFAERWITYCEKNDIEYKLVNAYDSDIVSQLKGCDAFMWHFYHKSYKDQLFAKQLLFSLQTAGIRVFPNFNTAWHFDDKVGQKYLLESIGAPLVPSYVYYSKQEALKWIDETDFPKVFKLRGGAGAENVKLVHSTSDARKLVKRSFGVGFKQYRALDSLKERWLKYRAGKTTFNDVLKGLVRFVYPPQFSKMYPPEKGYVYFQDFIPDNHFDIRVVVVGNKAFALKRMTRKGDFRASGSGNIIYSKAEIDERCVKIAFEVNEKLKAQSIAYDFVFDKENNPLIVEISFGYIAPLYDRCEGYWTVDMQWHAGENFDFCGWMVEGVVENINGDKK
jgi:glutathione synthase/RimK-type ligase-like ATP-grasp enzyme